MRRFSKVLLVLIRWLATLQRLPMASLRCVLLAVALGVVIFPSPILGQSRTVTVCVSAAIYCHCNVQFGCSTCYNDSLIATIFLYPQAKAIHTSYGTVFLFPPSAVYQRSADPIDGSPFVWKGTTSDRLSTLRSM